MEEQVNKKTVGIMISTTEKAGRALSRRKRVISKYEISKHLF